MEKRQFPATTKPKKRGRISPKSVLVAAVALIVLFLLLTSVIGLAQKYFAIRRRIADLKEEQARLHTKEVTLTEKNAYLATPEGAEQNLRNKFNVVKPGEEMIVINTEVAPPPMQEQGRVSRWWDTLLKGLGLRK